MSPSPTPHHQRIAGEIYWQIKAHLKEVGGGDVFISPIDVYLSETNTYQPDVIFISEERRSIIGAVKIEGAPDLVVEVLSPSNAHYDLGKKQARYEQYGVREYWIVDPAERTLRILRLQDGQFKAARELRERGLIESTVLPELAVDIADIFATP